VISDGLAAGEQVVISPVKGAANGMKIKPVDRLDVNSPELAENVSADEPTAGTQ